MSYDDVSEHKADDIITVADIDPVDPVAGTDLRDDLGLRGL